MWVSVVFAVNPCFAITPGNESPGSFLAGKSQTTSVSIKRELLDIANLEGKTGFGGTMIVENVIKYIGLVRQPGWLPHKSRKILRILLFYKPNFLDALRFIWNPIKKRIQNVK